MKTSPTGIRFETDDLDFIKRRENLDTSQKVVNFLLSEYCKLYRVEKKSVFGVYPAEKESPVKEQIVQSKTPVQKNPYIGRIYQCKTIPEIENVMRDVKNDSLVFWVERTKLEAIAKEHSKDFFND